MTCETVFRCTTALSLLLLGCGGATPKTETEQADVVVQKPIADSYDAGPHEQTQPAPAEGLTFAKLPELGDRMLLNADARLPVILAAGDAVIARSADRGATWEFFEPEGTASGEVWVGEKRALIGGGDDTVLYSYDQGQTWRRSTVPGGSRILGVAGVSGTLDAYALGFRNIEGEEPTTVIAASRDGGASWTTMTVDVGFEHRPDQIEASGQDLYVSAAGEIAYSRDRGSTWKKGSCHSTYFGDLRVVRDTVFAVSSGSSFCVSHDRGETWTNLGGDISPLTLTEIDGEMWMADDHVTYRWNESAKRFEDVSPTAWVPGVALLVWPMQPGDQVLQVISFGIETSQETTRR